MSCKSHRVRTRGGAALDLSQSFCFHVTCPFYRFIVCESINYVPARTSAYVFYHLDSCRMTYLDGVRVRVRVRVHVHVRVRVRVVCV